MNLENRERVASLHKYFLNSSRMKTHYDARAVEHGVAAYPGDSDWSDQWIYLSLWYSTLFVVAEGWQELGLVDDEIGQFLDHEENLSSLRKFRNGVFHFQPKYHDDRLVDFISLGAQSAVWVRGLHSALGRSLLARMQDLSMAEE
ncbi:hypothetical protein [Paenarthrobacter sp. PH39-S1]|uniref:hypothetical protein n=1 Tax=Paenarthrobacter sp. PH39-S1 TaxID=3046204 RepID=UPI0024BB7305|nr:hypothetical protein [Paenarthrobacter sp. PH39-S1]MDJ0357676.1 hypothetical protein [Paenarthrobacter sp. PH39-S1]